MVEDIGQEIYNAIRKDNLELFEKHVNEEHAKELSFGRFPILSLCYLYNAKKIINKYEDELLLVRTYIQIPEKIETYSLFKKKAGRNLRLYAGTNNIIHPLEMLSILGKASRLEKVYPKAIKTNSTIENLKTIERVKSSTEINPTETKIQMPKQPIPKKLYKIAASIMSICLVFAIVFTLAAFGVVALGDGSENHPYYVRSASQLEEAMSKGEYIVIDGDFECESLSIGDYDGHIDGNSHTITLTNQTTNILKNFTGSIKDLNLNIQLDYAHNASSGILTYKNSGEIDNVNITINGQMKYTGASTESIFFGVMTFENTGTISNSTISGTMDIVGNTSTDVVFSAITGTNKGTITSTTTDGTFNLSEVNGAMGVYVNYGDIDGAINNAAFIQTSQLASAYLKMAGICNQNYGTVQNCTNNGEIKIIDDNEERTFPFIGGIVCENYSTIKRCKNNGQLVCDVKYGVARIGGICADAQYLYTGTYIPMVEGCASIGKTIVISGSEYSYAFVGGIAGVVSGGSGIKDNYSIMENELQGTFYTKCISGVVGAWPDSTSGLENNAYLQTDSVPYGLYLEYYDYIYGRYRYKEYESFTNMFTNYKTLSEIEALEIYW